MAKEQPEKVVSDEPTMAQVLARLAEIAAANTEVQKAQLKQTAPRSNAAVPKISVFNPQGEKDYPMPDLKCEIQPWNQTPAFHAFTREEVELLNALEPGRFVIDLNDGSTIVCEVVGDRNSAGTLERLTLMGAKDLTSGQYGALFTHENKALFPALAVILRSMLEQQGTDHAGVMTMRKQRALVQAGELPVSLGA